MKNKTTTIILSVCLGGAGAHHFYLGNTQKGILYLLFFWTGVPAILALIDFINYLKMSDEEFNLQYNSGLNPGLPGHYQPVVPGQSMPVAPGQIAPSIQVQNAPTMMPVTMDTAQDEFIVYLRSNAQILQEIIEQHKQKQNTISQTVASSFEQPQPNIPQTPDTPGGGDKIDVSCAHCGHIYKDVSIKHRGRTVSCKKCQQTVTI